MKNFLIIEKTDREDEHHIVTADTFEEVLEKAPYEEWTYAKRIEDSLSYAYTEEAFPPTRFGKPILNYKHHIPEITVYEIVDQLDHASVKAIVDKYISATFDKAVIEEKKRRAS